jgi:glycopeptide antibiotics resistance protein
MYTKSNYTKQKAKQLNVIVKPSSKANYKIDVFDKNGDYINYHQRYLYILYCFVIVLIVWSMMSIWREKKNLFTKIRDTILFQKLTDTI